MPHSTRGPRPKKPRKGHPLFPHRNGQWAKKINGRRYYFGQWADPKAALDLYLIQKDDLYAGRSPRAGRGHGAGMTLADVCNHFLTWKQQLLDNGELMPRTWERNYATCDFLIKNLGGRQRLVSDLDPVDFETLRAKMAKRWRPVTIGNVITTIRSIFGYAY